MSLCQLRRPASNIVGDIVMANLSRWWSSYSYGEILNFIAIGPDDLYTREEIESMFKKYILKLSEIDSSD
jgi:hypothetical protein